MSKHEFSLEQLTDQAERLEDAGSLREALEAWRAALRHFTTPYLLCRLGRIAAELGEWAESEQALLAAIDLAPDFPGPYNALGSLNSDRGDLETAQDYFRQEIALKESPEAYTLLGVAQDGLGLTASARWSYNKAIALDPNYEEAYYNLAVTFRSDQPEKAHALLEKAIELDPIYQIAHRELGYTLRNLSATLVSEGGYRRIAASLQ